MTLTCGFVNGDEAVPFGIAGCIRQEVFKAGLEFENPSAHRTVQNQNSPHAPEINRFSQGIIILCLPALTECI